MSTLPTFETTALLPGGSYVHRYFACHSASKAEQLMWANWPHAIVVYARERDGLLAELAKKED